MGENFTSRVGYLIRNFRIASDMTQKELADKCGLNESTIRNYELGNRYPDAATLLNIAGAKSMNNNFSSFIVPSKHLLSLPWMFPVIFFLKYDKGAISNALITIPLAFFSVLVAVSSTKTLLIIFIISFFILLYIY